MKGFESEGFEIVRSVVGESEIEGLRDEVDFLVGQHGLVCVRGVTAKSETIADFADSASLRSLIPPHYLLVRSILFDKTPEQNWPVAWHQDVTIAVRAQSEVTGYGPWSHKDGLVHVQPPTNVLQGMLTLRVHLDPTPAENAALRVITGSHRCGKMVHSEVQAKVATGKEVVCACAAGDVLKMSPLILHASARSQTVSSRRVLHFEYADPAVLDPRLQWAASG
jgi:hypothetical protein